jgi:DNA-binding response OmpR family regulator
MTVHSGLTPNLEGRRVLVVEDDPLLAAELQDALERAGACILGPVPSVRAAMAMLSAHVPDAAVLDVNLRSRSSAPVADALRDKSVPVVLVTAYDRDSLDDPRLGGAPVLCKPLRAMELMRVLLRVLAGCDRSRAG